MLAAMRHQISLGIAGPFSRLTYLPSATSDFQIDVRTLRPRQITSRG
jgi:hypothetical protein